MWVLVTVRLLKEKPCINAGLLQHTRVNRMRCLKMFRRPTRDAWSSAHEAGTLVVERPARHQVLHGDRVVAGAEAVRFVEFVRLLHLLEIDIDAKARFVRE